jgi:hypothetical protein
MSDKDIKKLIELAKQSLEQNLTKSQALASLVSAGILNKDGNYTKHYKHLAAADRKYKK